MTTTTDEGAWELNPGDYSSDPDYSPESWEAMSLADYIICIGNYGDDFAAIEEVLRSMPEEIYAEYAALGFPELPEEMRDPGDAPLTEPDVEEKP